MILCFRWSKEFYIFQLTDYVPCVRILINPECQKCSEFWYISVFKPKILHHNTLDFSNYDPNRTSPLVWGARVVELIILFVHRKIQEIFLRRNLYWFSNPCLSKTTFWFFRRGFNWKLFSGVDFCVESDLFFLCSKNLMGQKRKQNLLLVTFFGIQFHLDLCDNFIFYQMSIDKILLETEFWFVILMIFVFYIGIRNSDCPKLASVPSA